MDKKCKSNGNIRSIECLSDYVKLLEDFTPSVNFVFRGENSKYDRRRASAFRDGNSGNFMRTINEYYSIVGHRLSDIEKQNFIAFAQHHRLPTNLLDVSSNPLSALFFSCYEAERSGYVYIYPYKDFIDITEIIDTFPQKSVFDLFISGNPTVINILHDLFAGILEGMRGLLRFTGNSFVAEGIGYTSHLFCKLFCITRDMYLAKNQITISTITFEEMLNNVQGDGVIRARELSLDFYKAVHVERDRFNELLEAVCKDDIMNDIDIAKIFKDDLVYYIIFLLYCFRVEFRKGNTDYSKYSELLPPMIYRPKITFERARMQQGYFIYMPYMSARGIYSDMEIKLQNISPIQTVEVRNPAKILIELDNIGINYGTVYGDYDSIAKYLNEKSVINEQEDTP